MNWPLQCAAVIPCFNEAGRIAEVVQGVRAILPSVIVVDDGSTDATAARARAAQARLLRHGRNRGKGAALHSGLELSRKLGFSWVLTLDGDGQHAPQDIPAFLDCVERTGASMIAGNRMNDSGAMPWLRRQVNRWMSRRLSHLAGVALPDSQCGFRLVDLEAWSKLPLRATRFEVESEWLLAFLQARRRVEFVPVRVIYGSEDSKIRPLADSCRWLRWWCAQHLEIKGEKLARVATNHA
jgi:glycosyltransferase involved in cell wall biosynthesis